MKVEEGIRLLHTSAQRRNGMQESYIQLASVTLLSQIKSMLKLFICYLSKDNYVHEA